jgi:uncharacterized protein
VEPVQVGVVKALFLYPVKSMGGHEADEAFLNWHGLDGDRKFAFVQDGNTSNFPWLTAREIPKMLHYTPYFVDPANRAKSGICVKTPEAEDLPVESRELVESLAAHWSGKFHLIHLNIGVFDAFPISLISTETTKGLSARAGFPVESNRFRPNILVEPVEPIDAIEDRWVGRTLCFGSAQEGPGVAVSKRDSRCVMVNYDRQTLKQTPELLREIAQNRSNCAGVYGSILKPGSIKVGDAIFLA